ncbi:hypothetical protein [Massilia consociata]|uniref:Uncharacterized protein n=1 Tax=Massilia consociata TaxID=760117 RepID=A0ABV6FKY4_9BURK
MTLAFENFMKQFEMTGSEKADGYSRDAFVGLDSQEKEIVFKLLVTELPWSAEWLFFLDPERALTVVKQKEEQLRGNSYAHVYKLQEQLVKHSGELLYQKHMIEDYANYADGLKPLVVDAIGRTPANEVTREFFKQVILVEVNASAVARASRNLLSSLKVPRQTESEEQNYQNLMDRLRSDSDQVKRRAIAELERFAFSKT